MGKGAKRYERAIARGNRGGDTAPPKRKVQSINQPAIMDRPRKPKREMYRASAESSGPRSKRQSLAGWATLVILIAGLLLGINFAFPPATRYAPTGDLYEGRANTIGVIPENGFIRMEFKEDSTFLRIIRKSNVRYVDEYGNTLNIVKRNYTLERDTNRVIFGAAGVLLLIILIQAVAAGK